MNSQTSNPTWERMVTWQLVLPPSRPDALDLERARMLLERVPRNHPVGVLGSTPEFRDLLGQMGFTTVYVLDRSSVFLQAMTGLRAYQNSEIHVLGDWLDTLPGLEGMFAVILSDLTAGNISYSQRADFYANIANALRPGGLFIDKNLTNPDGLIPLDDIKHKYAFAPVNLQTANYYSCEAIFCSELQAEDEQIETSAIYNKLEDALKGPRFERLIQAATTITPLDCLWYYGRSWSLIAKTYCPDLELITRYDLEASQPYYKRAHQYVWVRRK